MDQESVDRLALCEEIAVYLRTSKCKWLPTARVAELLEILVAGDKPPGWIAIWHSVDTHKPPMGEQVLLAGALRRGTSRDLVCVGYGIAESLTGDSGGPLKWKCWPFGLEVTAWMQLPNEPFVPTPEWNIDLALQVALLRTARSTIELLEAASSAGARMNVTPLVANQHYPDSLSGRITTAVGEWDQVEWIGPWIELRDRRPNAGQNVVIRGSKWGKHEVISGVGRYGMEATDSPFGYLPASYEWHLSPPHLNVKCWLRFPKTPTAFVTRIPQLVTSSVGRNAYVSDERVNQSVPATPAPQKNPDHA